MFSHDIAPKLAFKSFEDGLKDALHEKVDWTAYQVNRQYQDGVEAARHLIARFDRSQLLESFGRST